MEFKLNKIDTDIRKKIKEERKESKVHSGKAINVNKDFLEENDNNLNNKNEESVNVEKSEKIGIQNSLGRILDTKK